MSSKPPSRQDVDAWLERIDDVSAAVQEILTEDAAEAEQRRRDREALRAAEAARERREKVQMRYDPRHYARFADDAAIDRMLREVDAPPRASAAGDALLGGADRVSLEEARRTKEAAAQAVRAADWPRAVALYDTAVALSAAPDPALHLALRNNRALALLKVGRDLCALEDASFVLRAEPRNVKALLRRATALRRLRRPLEALRDAEAALRAEPRSAEAAALAQSLRRARAEHRACAAFQREAPGAAQRLRSAAEALRDANAAVTQSQDTPEVSAKDAAEVSAKDTPEVSAKDAAEVSAKDTAEVSAKDTAEVSEEACDGAMAACLTVLHASHRGAAVFFALNGGVRPAALSLRRRASRLCDTHSAQHTFAVAARLVAAALAASEVAAAELSAADAAALAERVTCAALSPNGTAAALLALSALCTRYDSAAAAVAPHVASIVARALPYAPLLHHCCALLAALLHRRGVSAPRDCVWALLAAAGGAGGGKCVLELAASASAAGGDAAAALFSADAVALLESAAAGRSPRAEEALYATVYNLAVRAERREAFVAQWSRASGGGRETIAIRAWRALGGGDVEAAVAAKMAGVLAKFAPHDEALRGEMVRGEETLWTLMRRALTVIEKPKEEDDEDEEEEEEEGEKGAASAWELVEHTTTCIAYFYARDLLSRETGLSSPERIETLLRIVRGARGGERIVALGNAALIASFVPKSAAGLFANSCAVDPILERLRDVRQFIFILEHDGKKGTTQWTHAESAQKNLAIALSKCCADESQRERLRELKGFETLYAILNNNPVT